jgi:hypothetical protein
MTSRTSVTKSLSGPLSHGSGLVITGRRSGCSPTSSPQVARTGGNARVTLADVLFDLDQADEARAQLDALRRERPSSAMPYQLTAELA